LLAGLGLATAPGLGGPALRLDSGGVGIGAGGLTHAGTLSAGNIGRTKIGGIVDASARSVRVPLGTTWVDRDAIAEVINSHLLEISTCFEQAMIKAGPFGGHVALEWTITTAGTVSSSRIKQTDIRNAYFGTCVLAKLNAWKFPAAHGGSVVVGYPLLVQQVGY
jgi:hypothetical protein